MASVETAGETAGFKLWVDQML